MAAKPSPASKAGRRRVAGSSASPSVRGSSLHRKAAAPRVALKVRRRGGR